MSPWLAVMISVDFKLDNIQVDNGNQRNFQWWFLLGNYNHQANPHIHQQHIVWATCSNNVLLVNVWICLMKRNFHTGMKLLNYGECFDKGQRELKLANPASLALLRVPSWYCWARPQHWGLSVLGNEVIIKKYVQLWMLGTSECAKKTRWCSLFSHKLKVHVTFRLVMMNRGMQGMNKQVMTASAEWRWYRK